MDKTKVSYEHVSILSGYLSEEEKNKEIEKYNKFFEEHDIKIYSFEDMGKRKLAYEVCGQKEGNYIIYKFSTTPEVIYDLESFVRKNENTLKFIDVRSDEDYSMENEESEEDEL